MRELALSSRVCALLPLTCILIRLLDPWLSIGLTFSGKMCVKVCVSLCLERGESLQWRWRKVEESLCMNFWILGGGFELKTGMGRGGCGVGDG